MQHLNNEKVNLILEEVTQWASHRTDITYDPDNLLYKLISKVKSP